MASDYLEPLAELMSDVFESILIDLPGSGRSPAVDPPDLESLVAAIDEVRVTLGLERWLVGGHSFGADLALAYALERPRHTRAVLAISPTGVQDDRDWHRAYAAGRHSGRDQVPTSVFGVNREVHRAALASWRGYIKQPGLLRRLAELSVPYLAVLGSEDVRPSWPVVQIVALVPAGEVVGIQGAGHCPWWSHAAELREAIVRFVALRIHRS
jgi:proline iminopeptidase